VIGVCLIGAAAIAVWAVNAGKDRPRVPATIVETDAAEALRRGDVQREADRAKLRRLDELARKGELRGEELAEAERLVGELNAAYGLGLKVTRSGGGADVTP
jgi:hypothetical protein